MSDHRPESAERLPSHPTLEDLVEDYVQSWAAGPGRGPAYHGRRQSEMLDPESARGIAERDAKNKEDDAYDRLVGSLASRVVIATETGQHAEVIGDTFRQIAHDPQLKGPLATDIMRDITIEVADQLAPQGSEE